MEKKSDADIKKEVEQRLREIELLKEEAQQQGLSFSSLSEKELEKKIGRESSKSPYIYMQSWGGGVSPGSSTYYTVYISNPDPGGYYPMFVSLFFGLSNFFDDIIHGWIGRDTRWPVLSSAPFSLAAGATTSKAFSYSIPTDIPPSSYLGNSVVWRGQWHDKGSYFDRGLFYVNVS